MEHAGVGKIIEKAGKRRRPSASFMGRGRENLSGFLTTPKRPDCMEGGVGVGENA